MHSRRIALDKFTRRITLEDTLQMEGEHEVELFLHCHEGCKVTSWPGGMRLERDGRALDIRWPDHRAGNARVLAASVDPMAGWISRAFDRKHPAPTLLWSARLSGRTMLRTEIECE
jgi:hypothetical protein